MAIIDGDDNSNNLKGTAANDTFQGKGGNDTLTGGGGSDIFKYVDREFNNDTITDFSSDDKIDLSALKIADFATLSRFITQNSLGEAVITFGFDSNSESITLKGFPRSSLTAANFVFNTNPAALEVNGTNYQDVLFGGNGGDALTGNDGSDTLSGGAGNDVLNGGTGNDILIGGANNDIFRYTNREFNADTIEGFATSGASADQIDLSGLNIGDFATLLRFIGQNSLNEAVITLGFDSNSESITLKGVPKSALTAANFIFNTNPAALQVDGTNYQDVLFGGNGGDALFGYDGSDTLSGGAGNDVLNAGSGNDTLIGGAGNDIFRYTGREFNADIIEGFATSGASADQIDLSGLNIGDFATLLRFIGQNSLGEAVITLGFDSNSESITLKGVPKSALTAANFIFNTNPAALQVDGTNYQDVLFGGNGGDALFGYDGSDALSGGAGNDVLNGGTGNDTLIGGTGNDIFRYTGREFNADTIEGFATSGASADQIDLSALNVADFATLSRFIGQNSLGEAVITLGFDSNSESITLKGVPKSALTAANFIFNTNPAALEVEGTNYQDVLFGGNGGDTLTGYDGSDTLSGGAGNDTLRGLSGNDILIGGIGADNMTGGVGNDLYYIDNAGDVITELTGEGVDTVYSSLSYTAGQFIENITLIGSAATTAVGNAFNNLLTGNAGNNTLNGRAGNDLMRGGAGNDTYLVDAAGDKVDESLAGSNGIDTIQAVVSVDLGSATQVVGAVENVVLLGSAAINATGNTLNNLLVGNSGNNILNGGVGGDEMRGGAGYDTYYVDNAADRVGEANVAGVDRVYSSISFSLAGQFIENLTLTGSANINGLGNSLNNAIAGNAGNNSLSGGAGNDVLLGGGGNDWFLFNTAPNATSNLDTILDYSVAADTISLENAIFAAIGGAGTLNADMFWASTSGVAHDASDRLVYETDTGKLFYDSNGSAAGGSVHFATLTPNLALTHADFLVV